MRRSRLQRVEKPYPLINDVRIGDIIKYVDSQGNVHTARIVMRSNLLDGAFVGSAGGRHGTPVIISDKNLVSISKRRRKH